MDFFALVYIDSSHTNYLLFYFYPKSKSKLELKPNIFEMSTL